MRRFLEEATRVVGLNSVSQNGNEELANHLIAIMQDSGFKVVVQQVMHSVESISKRQFNVIGILGDPLVDRKIRKGLLLLSHLDSVGPGILEFWTENAGRPFDLIQKGDELFGLGTADSKLDFLCKIYAAQRMRDKKLRQPVYVVGTCGEELGMFGARYLLQSFALNPKYVLVGNPTSLKLATSHKSASVFRMNIGFQATEKDAKGFNRRVNLFSAGRSGHAAHPESGVNALLQAIDFVQSTVDQGFDIQITRIEGGETVNQIPDRARIEFYLTSHQFEDFKRYFRENARGEGKETAFKVELGGLGESGISFLPAAILPCVTDAIRFFSHVVTELERSWSEGFDPPTSSISLGLIKQDGRALEMFFDVRLLPWLAADEVDKKVQAGIAELALKYPAFNIKVGRERINPGLEVPDDHEWVKLCQSAMEEVGLRPETTKTSLCSEAGLFAQKGYPALSIGAGAARGNIHGPNERTLMPQLQQSVSFYEKMIEKVCL